MGDGRAGTLATTISDRNPPKLIHALPAAEDTGFRVLVRTMVHSESMIPHIIMRNPILKALDMGLTAMLHGPYSATEIVTKGGGGRGWRCTSSLCQCGFGH